MREPPLSVVHFEVVMSRALAWVPVALMIGLLVPASAAAQQLTGTIRPAFGEGGVPGVILMAVSPVGDSLLARTISGSAGQFTLRLPVREVRLRALRIGHQPTELGLVTLAAAENRRQDFRLEDTPVTLQAVTTTEASRCDLLAGAGVAVADLFEEARKTLVSSLLSSPEGAPSARIVVTNQIIDLRGRPLTSPVHSLRSGPTAKPFQSLPAELLAEVGYVSEERDGTVYRAPDAQVLLSSRFAADHCMQVVEGRDAPAGLVGLAFRPVGRPGRDHVRIRGTLWIDRATFELTTLEYAYVGLPPEFERAGLGGSVTFTRLEDGIVFESAWEIRMPRVSQQRTFREFGSTLSGSRLVIDAIHRTRGEVLSLSRGGTQVFVGDAALEESLMSATGGASALAAEERDRVDFGGQFPSCSYVPDEEPKAMLYGAVRGEPSRGAPGTRVTATWKEGFQPVGNNQWRWTNRTLATTSADGFYSLCGAPRARLITMTAESGSRRSKSLAVRVPWYQERARADLTLPSP